MFELGRTVATNGVATELTEREIIDLIRRHHSKDWGICVQKIRN